MSNALNFRLTLDDLLSPGVAAAIRRVAELGREVERPHRLNVDTSQASGAVSGIMGLVGKLGLVAALATGTKAVIGMGVGLEQTRVQFETFTGSAEKGNAVIAELQKFANLTPFDDEQVISAGRQLLAFGEDAKSLNPILTKLGNISSATGKDFGELVSIYGKNKLSGIIQGEDLNQLNDSGIPVMKSLAAQLGVTTDKVKEMGAKGKITFAMLDKSFDELGGAGGTWGELMDKQSQTVAGRWSSLVGFAQNLGGQLGEALNPFIGSIVDSGTAVLQFIQQNKSRIRQMLAPVERTIDLVRASLTKLARSMGFTGDASQDLEAMFQRLSPIVQTVGEVVESVATAVVDIGTALGEGYTLLDEFWTSLTDKSLKDSAVDTFRDMAADISLMVGAIAGSVELLVHSAKTAKGYLNGDFRKTFEEDQAWSKEFDKRNAERDAMVARIRKGSPAPLAEPDYFGSEGSSAPADFLKGGGKKPAALTADASKGKTAGVSGVGGKGVTNIYFTVREMLNDMTLNVASASEGAKQIAQLVRDTVIAELNDVNTLASTN